MVEYPINKLYANKIDRSDFPETPPLPKYDPKEEAPMWTVDQILYGTPVDKSNWPKIGDVPKDDDKPDWRGVIKKNVNVIPMPEVYKIGRYNDEKYFWFDTPDYADPFKKLGYAAKFFAKAGICALCLRAGFIEMCKFTTANNLRLFRLVFVPTFAAGMAGSATVITVANLRKKKDDYWNYAAGGFVAGSILGRKLHTTWFWSVLAMTPLAVGIKHNAEINGRLMPLDNYRGANWALSGLPANNGILSGDFRMGVENGLGDPGRAQRRFF